MYAKYIYEIFCLYIFQDTFLSTRYAALKKSFKRSEFKLKQKKIIYRNWSIQPYVLNRPDDDNFSSIRAEMVILFSSYFQIFIFSVLQIFIRVGTNLRNFK